MQNALLFCRFNVSFYQSTKSLQAHLISSAITYYFDENGDMITGWLKSGDGCWYFFDIIENNLGKESINEWKQISGDWYFFDTTGKLLQNTITPDGYTVDGYGKWRNLNAQ